MDSFIDESSSATGANHFLKIRTLQEFPEELGHLSLLRAYEHDQHGKAPYFSRWKYRQLKHENHQTSTISPATEMSSAGSPSLNQPKYSGLTA